jgi:hypothetical protein
MDLSSIVASDGIVHAQPAWSHGRRPKVYASGRVCAVLGCRTILSVYNGSSCCAVHQPLVEMRRPFRVHRTHRLESLADVAKTAA